MAKPEYYKILLVKILDLDRVDNYGIFNI